MGAKMRHKVKILLPFFKMVLLKRLLFSQYFKEVDVLDVAVVV